MRQSAWRGKLGDPKTDDSTRVVELSPQSCAHLRTFLKSWHPNERRLLFATRNGTPWDQNLLLKRKFRPLLRALGIQVPRGNGFHSFRHANATLMSSFGASQKIAPAEARTRRWVASHGDDLHARDQRGRKAYCGATWQRSLGNFGRQLDGKGKRLESGVSQAVCYQLRMVAGVRFELTTFGL